MTSQWEEVKPGQSVGMMQGMALNLLASKLHPSKMEMGFLNERDYGYRLTLPDGQQAVYVDHGDCLERLESINRPCGGNQPGDPMTKTLTTTRMSHTPEPWPRWTPNRLSRAVGIPDDCAAVTLEDYEHARGCVNACAGINPGAVPKLLAALKRLIAVPIITRSDQDEVEADAALFQAQQALTLAETQL